MRCSNKDKYYSNRYFISTSAYKNRTVIFNRSFIVFMLNWQNWLKANSAFPTLPLNSVGDGTIGLKPVLPV